MVRHALTSSSRWRGTAPLSLPSRKSFLANVLRTATHGFPSNIPGQTRRAVSPCIYRSLRKRSGMLGAIRNPSYREFSTTATRKVGGKIGGLQLREHLLRREGRANTRRCNHSSRPTFLLPVCRLPNSVSNGPATEVIRTGACISPECNYNLRLIVRARGA